MLSPRVKKVMLVAVLATAAVSFSAQPSQAGWWHYPVLWDDCCPSYVMVRRPVRVVRTWDWCCNPCVSCWSCCSDCGVVEESCCGGGKVISRESAAPSNSMPTPAPKAKAKAAPGDDSVLTPKVGQAGRPSAMRSAEPTRSVLTQKRTATAMQTSATKTPNDSSAGAIPADGALLLALVPTEAQVYINGVLTTTTGTERQYLTEGLLAGHKYPFRVEAVIERDGRRQSDSRIIDVRVGDSLTVSFHFADERVAQN